MSASAAFRHPAPPRRLVGPPSGKVLVLAPHPDDETMGAGGTLALHAQRGDPIDALFVCNGIQGDPEGWYTRETVSERRRGEARLAAKVLGIGTTEFLDYPDNLTDADLHLFEGLPEDPDDARRALAAGFASLVWPRIQAGGYEVVYYPWEGEANGDHWVIAQGVRTLRDADPEGTAAIAWMGYDVWTPCPGNVVVDTSDVIARKVEAVQAYRSQTLYLDYVHPMLGLDAYRSLFLERGATYGEAFVAAIPPALDPGEHPLEPPPPPFGGSRAPLAEEPLP